MDTTEQQTSGPSTPQRCGIAALVGRANVGKSTLINALLEEKVSIVSSVAQTTRTLIRGILTEPRGQIVFLDTPGMHKAVGDLGRVMNRKARAAAEGVDIVVLVLDGSVPPQDEDDGWMQRLAEDPRPVIFAVNKTDKGSNAIPLLKSTWEPLVRNANRTAPTYWLTLSAISGNGTGELVTLLFSLLPEAPLLFPEDMLSDYPRKLFMADLIREKYFLVLREEIPHAVAVAIDRIDDSEDGGWLINGEVMVNKASQKGIVIGKGGALLKKIQKESARELAAIYERPIRLVLHVKTAPQWARNKSVLDRLGYL